MNKILKLKKIFLVGIFFIIGCVSIVSISLAQDEFSEDSSTLFDSEGSSGWFFGLALSPVTVTVKFPKISQSLFGYNEVFEGNEFKYSGLKFDLLGGYKKSKFRFYTAFGSGTPNGGIEQSKNPSDGLREDSNYTRLDISNFSLDFDYFLSNGSRSLFIGGGWTSFSATLLLNECEISSNEEDSCNEVTWYSGSSRIRPNTAIKMSGSFPVARIGYSWDFEPKNVDAKVNFELSYTRYMGVAKGTGIISVHNGSGLSSNPNARGPYKGELEASLPGFVTLAFNIYF